MTKKDLEQLKKIHKEIQLLQKEIKKAEYNIEAKVEADTVKGSRVEFPYTEVVFKIEGINYRDYERKVRRLKRRLAIRLDELMNKVEEINKYIEGVEDSEVRQVLQLRYVNGLTWEQIEQETNMSIRTAKRRLWKWEQENKQK